MTGADMPTSIPRRAGRYWTAAGMLKLMLAAQCGLALLVVGGDLSADMLRGPPWTEPRSPAIEIPVAPGNQTRRFEPRRLPMNRPGAPDFVADDRVPLRLEFGKADVGGRAGVVLLTGSIADGDARRFADWLKGLPDVPTAFVLHSPGGAVDEAIEIGRMIRLTGVPVVIASGASCFSACPYILAGGIDREVSKTALVGVHQHYFGENTYLPAFLLVSDIQVGQGEVMTYLAEMGINPMVMAKALMTPPDDIYILLPEELTGFGLATVLVD